MARINLLPWRENLRKQRQREFGMAAVGALVITLLLGLLVHVRVEMMIDHQKSRNAFLEKEIAEMDRKIREIEELEKTKARLLARMNVIQTLQGSRPEVVHLFDELVNTIPDGAFLTKVTQINKGVTLDGRAQSNARVSAYMRNVDASQWIGNPNLQVIENKNQTGTGFSHFTLSVAQMRKQAMAPKGGAQ
jgi:type IV pilus assembly protein PilN